MRKPPRNEQQWEEQVLAQSLFDNKSEYSNAAFKQQQKLEAAGHLDRKDITALAELLQIAVLFGRSTPNE